MSSDPRTPDQLRTLFLFEKLTGEQLDRIAEVAEVKTLDPGLVYQQGRPAEELYILLHGDILLTQQVGEDELELVHTTQRGVYAGAVQAYLGDRGPQQYTNSMKATVPSSYLVLPAADFAAMVQHWFPMGVHLLEGLFLGMANTREVTGQRERLMALGSLSAGLTHELNNPAVSAVRSAQALAETIAELEQALHRTLTAATPEEMDQLTTLRQEAVHRSRTRAPLRPMEVLDREEAIEDWLEAHGIEGSWDLAPVFVQADLDTACLDRTAGLTGDPDAALHWLGAALSAGKLLEDIQDSTRRISSLVEAAKQYSQLDRAPFQHADVRQLLESTLVMFQHRITDTLEVVRNYDPDLPAVPCYPAELNQVWTNLIDNALDSMNGQGILTINARTEGESVLVEIGDTGPGVPPHLKDRIFEPFFSTKPVGHGTGLGLDISWRIVVHKHHGTLDVDGGPGSTCFRTRLPCR